MRLKPNISKHDLVSHVKDTKLYPFGKEIWSVIPVGTQPGDVVCSIGKRGYGLRIQSHTYRGINQDGSVETKWGVLSNIALICD